MVTVIKENLDIEVMDIVQLDIIIVGEPADEERSFQDRFRFLFVVQSVKII